MDIHSLSDDELIQELKRNNIEYGPVIASTRRVYEKKLLRVLENSGNDATSDTVPIELIDEAEYDEVDEDDDDVIEPVPVVMETRRTTVPMKTVRQRTNPEPVREQQYESTTTYSRASRYTTSSSSSYDTHSSLPRPPIRADDVVTQTKPQPEKQQKKSSSIWLQLFIVIIVGLFIFVVFQNMESANQVPTRSIEQEV